MTKRTQLKGFLAGLLVAVGVPALAATFNLFSPAAGILKGNPSTYVTTAATSADVVATFSGTCNSGTVLKGDGSCAAASSGSVTSVALTMPSGFSVGGSPVTSAGTLAVTTTLNGNLRGNGSGFTTGAVALGSEVSGTLPVANGGTGAVTLTGPLKGNGTSAFTAAVAADIYGLWSGTCNSGTFLRGDGSCQSPGGGGTVTSVGSGTGVTASPNPIVGAGTLAVDQAFTPNWSGTHTFSNGTTQIVLNNSSAAADAKNTLIRLSTAGSFRVASASDAAPSTQVATLLTGDRSGSAWTALSFGNVTNNPTYTFLGSGTVTATAFSGGGGGLTSLDAGNVSAGTLAVARGGTGVGTSTGTGNVVLSASPTLTGTVTAATVAATTVTVGGNNVCQSTGTNCPATTKISSALINAGTGAALSGSVNISSCSGSAGSYSCTFSSAYANAPACAAGVNSTSNPPLIGIANPSTGSVTVATVLASTGATSTPASVVNLVCSGT